METKKRYLGIDLLKGIAMILIILLHSIQRIDGIPAIVRLPLLFGQVGVQLFFVCSGFLLAKTYFKKDTAISFSSHGKYMLKKYISLALPFIFFLIVYIIINLVFEKNGIEVPYENNTSLVSVLLNALMLHGLFPFCLNNVVPGGWYVGTLFLLLLISALFRFEKKKTYELFAVAIAAVAVALSVVLNAVGVSVDNGSYFYFSFFNQLPAFIIGIKMGAFEPETRKTSFFVLAKVVFSFAIVLALFFFGFSFSYAVIPILSAVAFEGVYELMCEIPEEKIEKFGGFFIKLGRNTYPIYLAHFLTVWYVPVLIFEVSGSKIGGVLLWIVSLLISFLLCLAASGINGMFSKMIKSTVKKLKL